MAEWEDVGSWEDVEPPAKKDKKKAGFATALKVANENAATLLDKAISLPAGALAGLFNQEKGDQLFREMDERERARMQVANPDNEEVSGLPAFVGNVATLPVQALGMVGAGADTGTKFLQAGESLPRAITASGIDTLGQAGGLLMGGAGGNAIAQGVSAAGANALQDFLTRFAQTKVAEKEETQRQFAPTWETTAQAGALGGFVGAGAAKLGGMPIGPQKEAPRPVVEPPKPIKTTKLADGWEQIELPLETSSQQVAEMRGRETPQMDLFEPTNEPHIPLDNVESQLPNSLIRDEEAANTLAKQEDIQRGLDERQAQMEFDVAKQQGLDFNAAERARQLEQPLPPKFHVPDNQRGAINLESILDGFRKHKILDNGIVLSSRGVDSAANIVEAFDSKGNKIGELRLAPKEYDNPTPEGNLNSMWTEVAPEWQGKGIAEEMYKYGAEMAGDIVPSKALTSDGRRMWDGFEKRGVSVNMRVPRKQRGGVDFQSVSDSLSKLFSPQEQLKGNVRDIIRTSRIPQDPAPETIIKDALSEGRDANVLNATKLTASGGSLEAATRRSALVQGVQQIVQNADKRANLLTQKTVVPVEQSFRRMSSDEIVHLSDVFKQEAMSRQLYTAEQLHSMGLSEKQMRTYAQLRTLFHDTLDIQNQAREAQGMKPISEKEYYTSSRWQGDFRQPVYDKEGKLAWYLADNTKAGLRKQGEALLKDFPDLLIDPSKGHYVKSGLDRNSLQSMYTTMLDVLGRDNPAVEQIKEAYESAIAVDTASTAGQQKHAERKANIRGFVGDRPGANPKTEALAMFQEQMQYAKNAYKWSAMQEAGEKLKGVFSDEALNTQQPKNMEYAKEYFQNNIGFGTARWVQGIENALRSVGVSPSVVDKGVGTLKSVFITQKLAMSAGYTLANLLQTANTMPHMVDQMVRAGGNPIKGAIVGMLTGIPMATTHYLNKAGLGTDIRHIDGMDFYADAYKYAEDNGVTSRSIYDEAPITSRGNLSKVLEVAGKTMTVPETLVRSTAYMMFVGTLKDSPLYKDNKQALFQKAEELTNMSMVDYRQGERPMMFGKLGVAGNALNTLQTFPINLYNQYRYFMKEAARGNVAPLATLFATQVALAGAMGIPGFNDLDKAWEGLKDILPDSVWAKVKDFNLKLFVLENFGEAGLYGPLSEQTGVSMTSRLSAPGLADMAVSPAAPITDLAKQAGSVANAVASPDVDNIAQAVRNISPTGLQGMLETGPFQDQFSTPRTDGTRLYKKSTDLADRQGQYARTPEEETIRAWGLRSQNEVFSNDLNYMIGRQEQQATKRSKDLVEKYYTAVRKGDMARVADIQKLYTELNGAPISDKQTEQQMLEEFTTNIERSSMAKKKLEGIKGLVRMQKAIDER